MNTRFVRPWVFVVLGLAFLVGSARQTLASGLLAAESIQFGPTYPSLNVEFPADSGTVGQFFDLQTSVPVGPLTIFGEASVNARASYLTLGASAIGTYVGPIAAGNVPAASASSLARFEDTLTIPGSGQGLIAYTFALSGFVFADVAGTEFFLPNAQPLYPTAGASLVLSQGPSSAELGDSIGFGVGPDQIFDVQLNQQTFVTQLLPFTFGTPFNLRVDLTANVNFDIFKAFSLDQIAGLGITGEPAHFGANFFDTAQLTGIQVFDADGNPIPDFTIQADSGTQYPLGVPEPDTIALLGIGGLVVGGLTVIRRRALRLAANAQVFGSAQPWLVACYRRRTARR